MTREPTDRWTIFTYIIIIISNAYIWLISLQDYLI